MESTTLVALTPAEMPAAQTALVGWCEQKIAQVTTIVADLKHNFEIATKNRWSPRHSLAKAIAREEKRIDYYGKIKAAVEAGYLIIPNFPVDAFAVRVRPEEARKKTATHISAALTDVTPALLAAGEGEYVDDKRPVIDGRYEEPHPKPNYQGQTITRGEVTVKEYDEDIDMPLMTVKPVVLQAVERAMALKIFDSLGIVQQRKADPIIVGTINDPREKWDHRSSSAKRVTFFVAWWLDLDTL